MLEIKRLFYLICFFVFLNQNKPVFAYCCSCPSTSCSAAGFCPIASCFCSGSNIFNDGSCPSGCENVSSCGGGGGGGGDRTEDSVPAECGTKSDWYAYDYSNTTAFEKRTNCKSAGYDPTVGDGAIFPKNPGDSHTWRCVSTYADGSLYDDDWCKACKNLYPIKSQTSCPEDYSASAGVCPDYPDNCSVVTVNYSLECTNKSYKCYLPSEEDSGCVKKMEKYIVPRTGYYQIQAWGAQGGRGRRSYTASGPFPGGKGGYTAGIIALEKDETIYLSVGCKGGDAPLTIKAGGIAGWNGGGTGGTASSADRSAGGGGGGASDIRRGGTALANRIMVAAGGGGASGEVIDSNEIDWATQTAVCTGAAGGGLNGETNNATYIPKATQTTGYAFGKGENGSSFYSNSSSGGGGGGWYGGKTWARWTLFGGGGGSSYISGMSGCVKSSYGVFLKGFTSNNIRAGDGGINISFLSETLPPSDCSEKVETYKIKSDGAYKITAWGAGGGVGFNNGVTAYTGGKGGYAQGTIVLKKGDILYIREGCQGSNPEGGANCTGGAGGWNGGGDGGDDTNCKSYNNEPGGGGGGASDVRLNGTSVSSRILVAGGGGGGGYSGRGGNGGNLEGTVGNGPVTAAAGTQYSGNARGTGANGIASAAGSGGGGGGWYGGKVTSIASPPSYSGGGGGSGFVAGCSNCSIRYSSYYDNKIFYNITMVTGVNTGNGRVIITKIGTTGSCSETNNDDDDFTSTLPKTAYVKGNPDGEGNPCYRPALCEEMPNAATITGFYSSGHCASSDQLIVASSYTNYKTKAACVACIQASKPWFQVVNGNVYAKGMITGNDSLDSNIYIMRNQDCTAASSAKSGIGIPISSSDISDVISQRTDQTTTTFSNGFANIDKENYSFFARQLGFTSEELKDTNNIKACPADLNSNNPNDFTLKSDGYVCFINGSYTLTSALSVPSGIKKIIFVRDNLNLKANTTVDNRNNINQNTLLMFIVKGDIIISPELGKTISTTTAGACINQNPSLHGIFIADGQINFPSTTARPSDLIPHQSCDKKITVKGLFIGWGTGQTKAISLNRTFIGCLEKDNATYYNYNATTPVITFVYDANLIKALPLWVNKTVWARFETI